MLELAGAILGTFITLAAFAYAYTRWGWAPDNG